jgi:hypothetical protein
MKTMNRLCIETCNVSDWRMRLANPEIHWKIGCSAFETAVSWECAQNNNAHGFLPEKVFNILDNCKHYENIELLFAIAEHKVPLVGKGYDSQCDVWALVNSGCGMISLSVEAKVEEDFGSGNETLGKWLQGNGKPKSINNRINRWNYIASNLPMNCNYDNVAYQLLHRCASAVIEAKRLNLEHAVFLVQSFHSNLSNFSEFSKLCKVINNNITAIEDKMYFCEVNNIELGIGWVKCDKALPDDILSIL